MHQHLRSSNISVWVNMHYNNYLSANTCIVKKSRVKTWWLKIIIHSVKDKNVWNTGCEYCRRPYLWISVIVQKISIFLFFYFYFRRESKRLESQQCTSVNSNFSFNYTSNYASKIIVIYGVHKYIKNFVIKSEWYNNKCKKKFHFIRWYWV